MERPDEMTIAHLEVLVMPNGEVLSSGKTIGWMTTDKDLAKNLKPVRNAITGEKIEA